MRQITDIIHMPRPQRADYAGAFQHVTNRGNHGGDIFCDDTDRQNFLNQLAAALARQEWRCHAYCLMGNHYHLLLETPDANLARGMQWFSAVLTQRFNRRHGLRGHLFQGRYKSVRIKTDSHLLQAVRYIALNPVRAGMAEGAENWLWSHHCALAGLAAAPGWLTTDWIWAQLAANEADAQAAYRQFVAEGRYLGPQAQTPWLEAGRENTRANSLAALRAQAAAAGDDWRWMRAAYHEHGFSLRLIAQAAGVSRMAVSRELQRPSRPGDS